ncbi:hypothetical protein J8F10_05980 [Gemmata sp. G18]|uniref:Uncharacterized protein n=1 Tax=Gemmata palustris TaxID=2822762 RepID=A0ABS5BND6_9BACT|nr:hypothetical protein [Gemmata palustris]MBP3954830.1 hypothetical protein [Gemmata palustris]
MRLSARVQKLEGVELGCDARVLRLAPEGHVPCGVDRCPRCGGYHVLVIVEEIVEAGEPREYGPEVRS